MKKLISILVLFLSHYAALANDSDIKAHSFSGFYINPNISYVSTDSHMAYKPNSSSPPTYETAIDGHGYVGGISLGYGRLYKDKYYLGIDLSADINPTEVSTIDDNNDLYYQRHTKIREKIGAALKAGYTIDNSLLLYLKAGMALMSQEYFQEYKNKTDSDDDPEMVWIDEPWDHGDKDLWQAKVGIGFEEQLNSNTTLTIEVDYIDDNNSLFFISPGSAQNHTVNAKQVKYMLGLSYYF